jgi:hypothetical protein
MNPGTKPHSGRPAVRSPPLAWRPAPPSMRRAKKQVKTGPGSVDVMPVNLENCPYDMTPISVHSVADSLLISCDTCGAAWEMHGSLIRRLRAPDAETVRAVRNGLFPPELLGGEQAAATGSAEDAAV